MTSPNTGQSAFGKGPIGSARMSFSGNERNKLFVNGGSTWASVGYLSGADSSNDGRVAVRADFDHDGDEDIAVANRDAPLLTLYRNESLSVSPQRPPVIALRVAGDPKDRSNRDAIGAVATVHACGRKLTRAVVGSDGFAGQSSPMLTFAIDAKCAEKLELEVRWPSGRVRKFSDVKPGFAYDVTEAGALKARRGYYPKREPPRASAQIPEWIRGIELGDKPTLVTLWASWCAACKNHVPRLNQLDGDGRLDVVAASIEPRDSETVTAAYREASSVDYKLLPYREQLAQGLIDEFGGLPPLPSSMLVTASGGITWIGTGLPSQSDIERALAASKPSKRNKRSPIIYFGAAAGGLALLLFIVAALRRRRSEPRDR